MRSKEGSRIAGILRLEDGKHIVAADTVPLHEQTIEEAAMVQDLRDATELDTDQRSVWGRSAATYVADFAGLTDQAIPALLDAASVGARSRVLDVASGPGIVAGAAAGRGAEVVGVDFAAEMVAVARAAHPGITFEEADAAALPFDDASFDAVVIGFGLHHMGRPLQALREARRVLQPGGRLACTVWAGMETLDAFQLVFGAMGEVLDSPPEESDQPPLFGVADRDLIRQVVEDQGFGEVTVEPLPIVWEVPTADSVFMGLSAWADFPSLPNDAQNAIRARVVESAEQYRRGDVYQISNPAILISGRR